jgi:hypothetical protein
MNEGYNPFPGLVYAPDVCTLQNFNTDGMISGCLASTPDPRKRLGPFGPTLHSWFYRFWYPTTEDAFIMPEVNGWNVFSTYNGPEGQNDGDPCPVLPKGINAHTASGPARFIRLNIWDVFGY